VRQGADSSLDPLELCQYVDFVLIPFRTVEVEIQFKLNLKKNLNISFEELNQVFLKFIWK
jgi:hypothetical protein